MVTVKTNIFEIAESERRANLIRDDPVKTWKRNAVLPNAISSIRYCPAR